jgi:hypothetical protein
MSRTGLLVTTVELDDHYKGDTSPIFNDLNLKLNQIRDLPEGAGPIQFDKDLLARRSAGTDWLAGVDTRCDGVS